MTEPTRRQYPGTVVAAATMGGLPALTPDYRRLLELVWDFAHTYNLSTVDAPILVANGWRSDLSATRTGLIELARQGYLREVSVKGAPREPRVYEVTEKARKWYPGRPQSID